MFQTYEEVQKTEFAKKTKEISEGIGEGLGKAGETIYKTGQGIGQTTPFKTVASVSTNCTFCVPKKFDTYRDLESIFRGGPTLSMFFNFLID